MTGVRLGILLVALGLALALPTSASAADPTVDMQGMAFAPAGVTVAVGGSVTWVNKDAAFHDAAALDGSWKSAKIGTNQETTVTFDTVGTYAYRCTLHPSMTGIVTVTAQAPDTDMMPTSVDGGPDGSAGLAILAAGLVGAVIGTRRFRRAVVGG